MQFQQQQNIEDTLEESLHNFQQMIESFRQEEGAEEILPVVIGEKEELIDGSHLTACSIYFEREVNVICLKEMNGEIFDFEFFLKHGLEQGYMELMAGTFAYYRKDCVGRYSIGQSNRYRKITELQKALDEAGCHMVYAKAIEQCKEKGWYYIFYSSRRKKLTKELCDQHYKEIEEALSLKQKEEAQTIVISKEEEEQCKRSQTIQRFYTKCHVMLRKALHLPIKKNEQGYGCVKVQKKKEK